MTKIRKKHGSNFKLKVALAANKGEKTTSELCQEFGIAAAQIYAWKKYFDENASLIFEDKRQSKDPQEEIDKLHRVIGKITAERDFLERALKK